MESLKDIKLLNGIQNLILKNVMIYIMWQGKRQIVCYDL